jgi:hypothetical protein
MGRWKIRRGVIPHRRSAEEFLCLSTSEEFQRIWKKRLDRKGFRKHCGGEFEETMAG